MTYLDEMNSAYQFATANAVVVDNPKLDKSKDSVEQLVSCGCFANYIVFVNGKAPISDTEMIGVFCPKCGSPASEAASVSGHSGGCFNATMFRMKKPATVTQNENR